MVFGQYEHQLDAKDRFRIPSKLKIGDGTSYVLLKGTNGCIFLYTKEYFETTFLPKFEQLPTFDLEKQKALRMILSSTYMVDMDNQGRIFLPSALKSYADIEKDIVSVGMIYRIEIWNKKRFDKHCDQDFDKVTSTYLGDIL